MKKVLLPFLLLLVPTSLLAQQKNNDINIQSLERNSVDNTPTSIVFSNASGYKKGQGLEIFQKYFKLDGVTNKVTLANTTVTKQRTSVERYEQYYKGIKVEQAGYTILYGKDERASYMNGNMYDISYNPSTTTKVTEQAACAKAIGAVNAKTYAWQMDAMEAQLKRETNDLTATYLPKGELVWIEDNTLPQPDRKLHLAYRFNVFATEPLSREYIYIDASTSKLLFRNSLIAHTNGSGTSLYSGTVNFKTSIISGTNKLKDSTRGSGVNTFSYANTGGTTVVDVTSATTTWATDAALDAHWGAEKVYDYWLTQQGRNSYNNGGAAINSYVHYLTNYNNAFWNGSQMTYGDGSGIAAGGFSPLTSIDVCAHEIGHAVCQYTANLAYNKESGAMNEGFSDIWGAIIEEYADPHETDAVAKSMWKIGEEIGTNPIRRMDNPNLRSQPDTYGGTYWVSVTSCTPSGANDYCGVHTNSGVLNYWFYLLCTGGSGTNDIGNAYSVTGIGTADGADIAYQTELLLTTMSTYANCRTASISAATTLFGGCSPQVEAVTRAWYAVGVGANYTGGSLTTITGTASVCVGGITTLSNTTSGGTWSSSNTSVATVGSTGIVSAVAAGTSNITYMVSGGCYATKTVTASITPTVSAITGTSTICSGNTTTLSNTTTGGTWSSSNTSVATVGSSSGVVTGVSAGNATITYSIGNACGTATATKSMTVNAAPAAITGSTTVPIGGTTTLSNATSGGIWSSSNTTIATVGSGTGVVTRITAGAVTISYTLPTGCKATVTLIALTDGIIAPDTVCAGNTVTFSTADTATTYAWNFGSYNVVQPMSSFTTLYSTGGVPAYTCFNKDGSNYYVFLTDYSTNQLRRLSYGTSFPTGTPTVTNLGSCGITTIHMEAIDIVKDPISDNWFGLLVASGQVSVLSFGSSLSNTPTNTVTNFYPTLSWAHQANLKRINGQWIAFIGDRNSTMKRLDFGSSLTNTPTLTTIPNVGSVAQPCNFTLYEQSGNWYMLVASLIPAQLTRYDFGTDLSNNAPTGTLLTAPTGMLNLPRCINLLNDCQGSLIGYMANETGNMIRVNFGGDITSTPTFTNLGATGVTSFNAATPCSYDNNFAFLTVSFGGTPAMKLFTPLSVASPNNINYYNPDQPHSFATPGTYNITLMEDLGYASNPSVRCKSIVVIAAPSITGSTALCIGDTTTLTSSSTGGTWSSSNTSVVTIDSLTGVVNSIASGTSVISYLIPGECGAAVVVTVSAATTAVITGPTAVAIGGTITLSASVTGGSWSSSSTSIASIGSSSGVVTGITSGIAMISYTITNGCGTFVTTTNITVGCGTSGEAIITTILGTGTAGNGGDGGSGTSTAVDIPWGVTTDPSGNVYVCDFNNNKIRKVSLSGIVTTVAGTGVDGFSGDGGPATAAQLDHPTGLVMHGGNLYVSDIYNFRIRKIDASGIITTVVGNGTAGFSGDGGPATAASIAYPNSLCLDAAGNIYIPDQANFRIRKVNTSGIITTIAGNGVYDNTGDGGQATSASMKLPNGTVVDAAGNVYFSDFDDNKIRKIDATTGIISTYAGTGALGYSGDSGPATAATMRGASGLFFDNSGDMIITDVDNHVIRKIKTSTGIITTIAGTGTAGYSGDGGDPLLAETNRPHRISIDASGNIYFSEWVNNVVRKITYTSSSTISGTTELCTGGTGTLTATPTGGVWSSSNTSIATIGASTGIWTGISEGMATITYSVGSGCDMAIVVTVNQSPAVITGASTVCVSNTTTLATIATDGTWSSSNIAIATVDTDGVVTGVTSGTFTISYTLSTGCYRTKAMTVNPLPSAITGTLSVCVGNTTVLSNSSSGGLSWTSSNPSVATIGSTSGLLTGISAGNTTITYTLTTGCTTTTEVTVNVAPGPISGTLFICNGSSTTLTSTVTGGTWTSANTGIATVGSSTGVVNGLGVGVVNITYMLSGCASIAAVTVAAMPSGITGTLNVCTGATTNLFSATTGGTWSSSDVSVATVGSTGIVTGILAGTATISYTIASGCMQTTTVNVTTGPDAISGSLLLCASSTSALTCGTTGGTWSSGSTAIAVIGSSSGIVSGMLPGTSRISYTLGSCRSTAIATVSPALTSITGSSNVCVGLTTTFSHSVSGGTWTSSNTAIATVGSTTGIITGIAAGTATVTYFSTPTCYMTKPITVNGGAAAITGNTSVCLGSTSVLSCVTPGGTSWTSSNTGVATIGATSGLVTGISLGTSNITYLATTGCRSTTVVTVVPLPSAITGTMTVCQGGTTALSSAGTTGGTWVSSTLSKATVGSSTGIVTGVAGGSSTITYTWTNACKRTAIVSVTAFPVSGAIVGAGTMSVSATQTLTSSSPGGTWTSSNALVATIIPTTGFMVGVLAGTVTISYTKTNSCGSSTSTRIFTITTSRPAPLTTHGDVVRFAAYPNPTSGELTVEADMAGKFTVYTIDGREISEYKIAEPITSIILPKSLSAGIYMCRFNGDDGSTVMVRLVVER